MTATQTISVTLTVRVPTLNVPHIIDGSGWQTTIVLLNPGSTPTPFTAHFFQPNGSPLPMPIQGKGNVSEYSDTIPVGGSRTIQTAGGADSPIVQGWLEITSSMIVGGTATIRRRDAISETKAGTALIAAPSRRALLPFDNTLDNTTMLAIANPDAAAPANLSLIIRDEKGNALATDKLNLGPLNRQMVSIPAQYTATRGKKGVVELSSSASGFSAFGLRSAAASIIAVEASAISVPATLNLPQVVDGGGWKTTLILVNQDSVPAPFTLLFRSDGGVPLSIPILGIGSVSEYSDMIPAGGVRFVQTEGTAATVVGGWAQLISTQRISGSSLYRLSGPDRFSETSLPIAGSLSHAFLMAFDNTQGQSTTLALSNPSPTQHIDAIAVFRDENGQSIGHEVISLDSLNRSAISLAARFPYLAGRKGVIEVTGQDLSALGLCFSGSGIVSYLNPLGE